MAKIKNVRIEKENKQSVNQGDKKTTKGHFIKAILEITSKLSKAQKIFSIVLLAFNVCALIAISCTCTGMLQSILIFSVFVLNLLAGIIGYKLLKFDKTIHIKIITAFCLLLCIMSFLISGISSLRFDEFFVLNQEIHDAKQNSELLLSTDMVDIYVNYNDKKIYSISNINGQKYVNENKWSESDVSEYYSLYTVGIEIDTTASQLTNVFLYPPTPYTITGYDYLIEFTYNHQRYVTRVFLPGMIDFHFPASARIFKLIYTNNADKYYNVSRVDEYIIFQSPYSTFTSPFANVKYTSEKEYFFVRYNRYLQAMAESENETVQEIQQENVVFIKSFTTMSPIITKVNFFWVGNVIDETFVAEFPVMEIIYSNNTCDIAVIKDIDAANLKGLQ